MSYGYHPDGRPRYTTASSSYGRRYYTSSQYPTTHDTNWSREPLSSYHTHALDDPHRSKRPTPQYHTESLPHIASPTTARPFAHKRTSYSKRLSWPPSPSVESETESLAKEVNPPRPSDADDVPLRGSTDQEPTLLGPFTLDSRGNIVSDSESDISSGAWSDLGTNTSGTRNEPTRPHLEHSRKSTSASRTARFAEDPLEKRKPDSSSKEPSRESLKNVKSKIASRNGAASVKRTDVDQKRQAFVDECLRSDALRGDGKVRSPPKSADRSSDISSSEPTTDDDWVDVRIAGERIATPYSMTARELKHQASDSGINSDIKIPPKPVAVDPRHPGLGSRQNSRADARHHSDDSPLKAQAGLGIRTEKLSSVKPSQFASDLTTSPVSTPTSRMNSAPDYLSFPRNDNLSSSRPHSPSLSMPGPTSHPNPHRLSREIPPSVWQPPRSRPVSRESSRPSSPHQFDDAHRRSITFPSQFEERPKRSSRLLSSTNTSELGMPSSPMKSSGALPYPVDDSILAMPSELDHQYRPSLPDSPTTHHLPYRDDSGHSSRQSSIASDSPIPRPRPVSRHTADLSTTTAGTLATSAVLASAMAAQASRPRDSGIGVVPREPMPCPRAHSSREYDDWYTLSGSPNFDICPECLISYFGSSPLKKHFKRQRRKASDEKTKCDFASPWMRHAYVLTMQQRHEDLEMMKAISNANASEQSCTGDRHDHRKWYTLRDRNGDPLNTPLICPRDVKKIKALFPALADGAFVRSPYSGQRGKCDMRASGAQFPEAIRLLTDVDADAAVRRRRPNLTEFIDLFNGPPPRPREREKEKAPQPPPPPLPSPSLPHAHDRERERERERTEKKSSASPCPRDAPRPADDWHVIPRLPEFTVCQACYSSVVWPAIASGSRVAQQVGATPVRIRPENSKDPRGASCQLYSDRMRDWFNKAVDRDDFDMLANVAVKRKAAEVRLVGKATAVNRDDTIRDSERRRVLRDVRSEWVGVWE